MCSILVLSVKYFKIMNVFCCFPCSGPIKYLENKSNVIYLQIAQTQAMQKHWFGYIRKYIV